LSPPLPVSCPLWKTTLSFPNSRPAAPKVMVLHQNTSSSLCMPRKPCADSVPLLDCFVSFLGKLRPGEWPPQLELFFFFEVFNRRDGFSKLGLGASDFHCTALPICTLFEHRFPPPIQFPRPNLWTSFSAFFPVRTPPPPKTTQESLSSPQGRFFFSARRFPEDPIAH